MYLEPPQARNIAYCNRSNGKRNQPRIAQHGSSATMILKLKRDEPANHAKGREKDHFLRTLDSYNLVREESSSLTRTVHIRVRAIFAGKVLSHAKIFNSHKEHKKSQNTKDDVELSILSCSCFLRFSWLFSFGCGQRPRWGLRDSMVNILGPTTNARRPPANMS